MVRRQYKIWNFFEKYDANKKVATCNYCGRKTSYKSTITNLKSHLKKKHPNIFDEHLAEPDSANVIYIAEFDDDDDNLKEFYTEDYSKTNKLPIWNFFQQSTSDNKTATCNYCHIDVSYQTSLTNLKEHLKQLHVKNFKEFLDLSCSPNADGSDDEEETDFDDDEECDVENAPKKEITAGNIKIWNFFEKSVNANKTAVCNYCLRDITFNNSVTNLKLHLKMEHNEVYKNSLVFADTSENLDDSSTSAKLVPYLVKYVAPENKRKGRRDVPIWNFFERIEDGRKTANCNYCNRNLSYRSTITNLKTHLQFRHKKAFEEFLSISGVDPNIARSPSLADCEECIQNSSSETQNCPSDLPIWKCFKLPFNKSKVAVCHYCNRQIPFQTSTKNLISHLQRKHIAEYNELLNFSAVVYGNNSTVSLIDGDVEDEDLHVESIDIAPDDGEETGKRLIDDIETNIVEPPTKIKKIVHVDLSKETEIENIKDTDIDLNLLKFIIHDLQPFSIVNDSGFRAYTYALNPSYKIPDQDTLSVNILRKVYDTRLKELKRFVKINAKSVCITIDSWSSCTIDNYMSITAHFLTEDPVKLHSVLIECTEFDTCNDMNIYEKLKKILQAWGIHDKVNCIVTDNHPRLNNAARHLRTDDLPHFVCFVYKFNLVVQEALSEVEDIISKVQHIVNYFIKNTKAKEHLYKYQMNQEHVIQPKPIIKSTPTKWNTVYLMLERFVELKDSVQAAILNSETNLPTITSYEWKCIEQISVILKPFYEATLEMCVDKYLVASKAFIMTLNLINICNSYKGLQDLHLSARALANKLKENMTNRLKSIESNDTISICAILDPRFKLKSIKSKEKIERIKSNVRKMIHEMNGENQNSLQDTDSSTSAHNPVKSRKSDITASFSLWCEFDEDDKSSNVTTLDELDTYLAGPLIKRTECPLKYWQQYKLLCPTLFKIFLKHYNTMVTSAPCEHFFSDSSHAISHRRTRLTIDVPEIMFLHVNKM